jgi:hypothetical protein
MAAILVLLIDLLKIYYNTRFRVLICEACHIYINLTVTILIYQVIAASAKEVVQGLVI